MLSWVVMVACSTRGRAKKLGWIQKDGLIQIAGENCVSPFCQWYPFLSHSSPTFF